MTLSASELTEREAHAPARRCRNCGTALGSEVICPTCDLLQTLGPQTDYFQALGVPRRLTLDPAALEAAFHERSRRYHPDFYRSRPRSRLAALENSALVNRAYRTLRDPLTRADYLLRLERPSSAGGEQSPPQELFLQILELQELLETWEGAERAERAALRPQLAARRADLEAKIEARRRRLIDELAPRWDALPETDRAAREAVLDELERLLGERGYLSRALDGLTAALEGRE